MKTLDEVIDAVENCDSAIDDCAHCAYFSEDCENLRPLRADALHYLKTIETTENLYHDAVNELSKWKDEDWKDRCLPLTWDELKQMEGKPVWVESEKFGNHWYLIMTFDDSKMFCVGRFLESVPIYFNDLGTTWNAYRKERNETD